MNINWPNWIMAGAAIVQAGFAVAIWWAARSQANSARQQAEFSGQLTRLEESIERGRREVVVVPEFLSEATVNPQRPQNLILKMTNASFFPVVIDEVSLGPGFYENRPAFQDRLDHWKGRALLPNSTVNEDIRDRLLNLLMGGAMGLKFDNKHQVFLTITVVSKNGGQVYCHKSSYSMVTLAGVPYRIDDVRGLGFTSC